MEAIKPKRKRGLLLFAILVLIPIMWFFFFNIGGETEQVGNQIIGKWLRYDGVYTIEIKSVNKNGTLEAAYFNPNPIEVGTAKWFMKDKKLNVFIELEGPYQKSQYKLVYSEKENTLAGTFYQAIAKETYNVYFNKVK